MPKQFYEMRYTVSQAAADGSNTATDLTPNVSFLLDISPEESFESIKARGNEAEIATCNLDFLKYLDEAYKTFWSEDMHNKGCSVFMIDEDFESTEADLPVPGGLTPHKIRRKTCQGQGCNADSSFPECEFAVLLSLEF